MRYDDEKGSNIEGFLEGPRIEMECAAILANGGVSEPPSII